MAVSRHTPDPDLDDFSDRLGEKLKARAAEENAGQQGGNAKGMVVGMRMATDIVAGVFVGAFLGWGADELFGTSPWALIICLLFGFAGGVNNAVRAANKLNAENRTNE